MRRRLLKATATAIVLIVIAAIIFLLLFATTYSQEYADRVALDGVYYARTGDVERAKQRFRYLMENLCRNGIIEDKDTPKSGHEYYKLALTLILACHLEDHLPEAREYIRTLAEKLLELQRPDGSWLTDDKDPETTYPNTETTILILIALDCTLRSLEVEPFSEAVNEAIEKGYTFLEDNLWDEAKGAYRECPIGSGGLENNHWGDDNHLALIFHRDYERFRDPEKVSRIERFLEGNPPRSELGMRRWCVLSADGYTEYQPYNTDQQTHFIQWILLPIAGVIALLMGLIAIWYRFTKQDQPIIERSRR